MVVGCWLMDESRERQRDGSEWFELLVKAMVDVKVGVV